MALTFRVPVDAGERARLSALQRLAVLDTLPEPVFDAITAAAAQVCRVPIALVSLIDADRQWFKANIGLPGVAETPRDIAFCHHAVQGHGLFEVADATADPRFAGNPLVLGDPAIRFYAGSPIVSPEGERVGTVCVIDRAPRVLDDTQRNMLGSLARIASACLAERSRHVAMTAALEASEARYRGIVEDQSELISLAARDGTLRFVNVAYARHFGLAPAQMIGRNLIEFVVARDREAVLGHLRSVCDRRELASGINRMQSADGRTRWVAWANRPLLDANGEVDAVQSVGRDVTEQRAAELALADSERRYRSLYESTPAILHSIDGDGRLVHVSDLWLKVFGYRRDEVIGQYSSAFLAPESRQRARDQVLPAFFRTGRCDEIGYQFVHKNGGLRDVLLSGILERDADGAPLRSMAVIEDVTDKKRLAAELARTHAHLSAVVDNVPAMLGYCDGQGVMRFANRAFQAAFGLPIDLIIGRPLREIQNTTDPVGFARVEPHIAEVMRGQRQEFEIGLLTTTGLRQLRMTLVPDQAGPGRDGSFYAMAVDITGRKALELRLSDSEQRYRSLFDNLNSGFALHEIVVDAQGRPIDYRFLAMNAAFTAMSGLDAMKAIGRCITELMPGVEADPGDWIGVFGRVVQSGEPVHFEQRSVALDRWFEVVAYRPAAGQFAVIAQDITQRKSAADQLALSEQRQRLLVDAVHDHSIILLDAQGQVETWNAGGQRIKGYASDQVLGAHYRRFFDADEIERGVPEMQLDSAVAYGRVESEGWRVRQGGARYWAAATITAVRDPAGRLRGFVEVTRDLTERQQRQALLHRVAELSPNAMLLFDAAGRIVFVNAQTEAMFGYSRDELIGRSHESLLPERLRASHGSLLPNCLSRGETRMVGPRQESTARRKDGTEFDAEVGLSAFDTEGGRVALAAVVDVTERRRQQQRLQDALDEKETLLKEVYHRVKNNLQVVQSLLNLQRRSMADGPARTALEESVQRVRAMALVHEKLYQSGNLAAVSLADYTHDLLKQIDAATGASQRRIRLVADIPALDTGLDNAIPFGLLVTELVGNSMKHGFAGRSAGEVRVSLAPQAGGVALAVADNGVGFAADFDLAGKASMGLQLAASLVRQLGGELGAETAGGARFSALLTRL